MTRQTITLMELPRGGWLWKEHGREYGSAVMAHRAVMRDARKLAARGVVVVTLITWEPRSDAGRIAAQMMGKP
jgi:hypothetical protein